MDSTEAIDELEAESPPELSFQELAAKETKSIVARALRMCIERGIAIGISCPPLRADGLADYLKPPQPQLWLHYYHTFVSGNIVSNFYCKICNLV